MFKPRHRDLRPVAVATAQKKSGKVGSRSGFVGSGNGQLQRAALPYHRHRQLGVLAPILLFAHSTTLGYAYAAVLSAGFIFNAMIGALDKTLIAETGKRQKFERYWLLLHVPLSMLVTMIVLFHIVYALAYK